MEGKVTRVGASKPGGERVSIRNYLADRRRAILDSRRYNILLALGHGAHYQQDEARRYGDGHFCFDR